MVDRSSPEFNELLEPFHTRMAGIIAEHGQCVQMVSAGTTPLGGGQAGVGFSYTIGNHLLGKPDLIMTGASPHAGSLLNYFHLLMKDGSLVIQDGQIDSETLNLPVKYVRCAPWVKDECTTQASNHYGHDDYPLFQVVLSDKHGRFPGDPAYKPTDANFEQPNYGAEEVGLPWPTIN